MDSYLSIVLAVNSLRYNVGKRLLIDILKGSKTEKIQKLRLDKQISYGILGMDPEEKIDAMIDELIYAGYLENSILQGYMKVVKLTDKGLTAVKEGKVSTAKPVSQMSVSGVTDEDRAAFRQVGSVLDGLSEEQKKCVTDPSPYILCIAGAGSGKTKALTKRAWFLAQFRNIPQERILAITFTRKARREMQERLSSIAPNVQVETFNSFCEKMLRTNHDLYYSRPVNVLDYKQKVRLVTRILSELKIQPESLLKMYFDEKKQGEDPKSLFLGFVNDLFSALDYKSNAELSDDVFLNLVQGYDGPAGKLMHDILERIIRYKTELGFRDYTDQIVHCLDLFRTHPECIPKYEHILVDEYQDVNDLQVKLIDALAPKNLFAVGDPRQSIFGWRGSKPAYIMNFYRKYPAKILSLTTNYRSSKKIVEISNSLIRSMRLPDMQSHSNVSENDVIIVSHENEDAEHVFVAQSILSQECKRNNIFVLARTNRQLEQMSRYLAMHDIKYLKRTVEEQHTELIPEEDQITLSTVHAIKGLEADIVYLIGANSNNFPCRASDHPLLEAIKVNGDYDKYQEELRLLYVALTRARKKLVINHHSGLSYFFNDYTLSMISTKALKEKKLTLYDELRSWRLSTSREHRILPYQVFSDRTLMQLCDEKPVSEEELSQVYGMGPGKLKRFGEDILEIIRKFP